MPALERQLRSNFDRTASFTVGAEEELMLVNPETFQLTPAIEEVRKACAGDRGVAAEFRASQVELISPVCVSVAQVVRELAALRMSVDSRLPETARLLAAGTHPAALAPGPVTSGARYERIAGEHPLAAQDLLTCGLHVHVAVGGSQRALAVYNALRSYLPEIVALGANAPFLHGRDAGVASVRPQLCRLLPRFGAPPAFPSWATYAAQVEWGRRSEAVPDPSFNWCDMRLHSSNGTIEVRASDSQTRVEDCGPIVALVQSLVCYLAERYSLGRPLTVHSTQRINESLWLAARDGLRGSLVDLTTAQRVPTSDRLLALAELLLPTADSLGCAEELLGIGRIVLEGGGASRQRDLVRIHGIGKLLHRLTRETCREAMPEFAVAATPGLVDIASS